MLASGCIDTQYSKGKEKVVINIHIREDGLWHTHSTIRCVLAFMVQFFGLFGGAGRDGVRQFVNYPSCSLLRASGRLLGGIRLWEPQAQESWHFNRFIPGVSGLKQASPGFISDLTSFAGYRSSVGLAQWQVINVPGSQWDSELWEGLPAACTSKQFFCRYIFLVRKGTLSSFFPKATAKGSCGKSAVIKECHQRLLKWWLSSKTAEVMAVIKDCHQGLLRWWLSSK